MRKTKVICTLGPAVDSTEMIKKLLLTGMDGARFNFSHGTHESHLATLRRLREACIETGSCVSAILDTKGPEIRVRAFAGGSVMLREGESFTLRPGEGDGGEGFAYVTYPKLHEDVAPGTLILLDDGLLSMRVEKLDGENVVCRVETGGELKDHKSINIPGVFVRLPALTEKDRGDLRFAAENDFDYVAASFVRSADDVREIRQCLDSFGGGSIRIIAKIENQQGVDNMDDIIKHVDGVMVARGDLGVEIPAAKVPAIQKKLIGKCRAAGKTVIIATQMLDSMINNPRPTRAEVSDVANAVYDCASCVMLSGETASGKHPIEALRTMCEVAEEAEKSVGYWKQLREGRSEFSYAGISDSITHTCCLTAMDLGARAIITATQSGYTAGMISRVRPACPIVALTPVEKVYRQLAIVWGVRPFLCGTVGSTDALFAECVRTVKGNGLAEKGDTVVITAGIPMGQTGSTNLIKAQVI